MIIDMTGFFQCIPHVGGGDPNWFIYGIADASNN